MVRMYIRFNANVDRLKFKSIKIEFYKNEKWNFT